jgi:hypothetical protein
MPVPLGVLPARNTTRAPAMGAPPGALTVPLTSCPASTVNAMPASCAPLFLARRRGASALSAGIKSGV